MPQVQVFEEMIGKTIVEITGAEIGSDDMLLRAETGELFRFEHIQDCCESVSIEQIDGAVRDLIGEPLVMAEEVTDYFAPAPLHPDDSYTWTFYKFATIKGYVTVRWLGQSNGYYSEGVSFSSSK